MVERAVDQGLDLFAAQGGLRRRGGLCRGLRWRGRLGLGLRWRGRWFRLLGLGWRVGLLHLAFNLRTLRDHESGLFAGHLKDLELFWRAFFASSGLVTVGVGHLT